MKVIQKIGLFFLILTTVSCRESFAPEVTKVNSNLLVVEGVIVSSGDDTVFKLSRTVLIGDKNTTRPEIGATVFVENNNNQKFQLLETAAGNYQAKVALLSSNKYRLTIRTKNGISYASDFVEVVHAPPITEVSFDAKEAGVQLYISTENNKNSSRYYRWDFVETWSFHALYFSEYYSDGKKILPRNMATQNIYNCWQTVPSNAIVLGSTVKLTDNIIDKAQLAFIPGDSEKISEKYSIIVRQYSLTKDAFMFWDELRKNTEGLGSIFDAQPSQLSGNIHNLSNPAEPALGYVSAGIVTMQRIFIDKSQVPNYTTKYPYPCNAPDSLYVVNPKTKLPEEEMFYHSFVRNPIDKIEDASLRVIGHTGSTKECTDCTIRGTKKKPDFWP